MEEYRIVPHAEIGALATQVYGLTRLAFGTYTGVLVPSEAHRQWYVRRPGMDGQLSLAALHRGQVVSSLFITVVQMRLAGRLQPVGIVDTVMTHPEHRQRGLARGLLTEAIRRMRERGLAASLLYTVPDSMPYHFYKALGYRPYAPVYYFRRAQPAAKGALPLRWAGRPDRAAIAGFLNAHFRCHDGYVPIDGALWRWRKGERPQELPADLYVAQEGGRITGCVTLCRAPIVGATEDSYSYVLTDLAVAPGADAQRTLASLLGAIPAGIEAVTLSARADEEDSGMLLAAGFGERGGEVGMVLPLNPGAETDLATPPRRWYVLAESVIGV